MTNRERLKRKNEGGTRMEMCYDGALVMPSSFALMNEEEMMYVEGGKFSKSAAKKIALTAMGYVLGKFIAGVTSKLLESAIAACAAWVKSAFETAILTVMCYPEKVAAVAAATVILGAAGYAVYKVGKNKKYW